jgi:O-antigen/teichoic acid export membrane protein
MVNSGLQASLGFAFWIVTARLFSPEDVGRASSLVSAVTVIAYLALLGLNNTFGRYLPTTENPNALVSSGLTLVATCGGVIALAYILLTPVIAPRLSFIGKSPLLAAGFVLIAVAASTNILTDSVFVASRRAGYIPIVDGLVGGIGKAIAVVTLVGTGTYGLFCASSMGAVLPAIASLGLLFTVMRYRPTLGNPLRALKPLLRYSGANYVGNVLNMLPTLIVPLIVLDRLGPAPAAYYFVSFQVASILYAAALSVEQTFLAEGSYANVDMPKLRRRSRRILMALCIPAALALVITGHWMLLAFGWQYYYYGSTSLILFAVAAGPIAAYYWLLTILRLIGKLRAIVITNVVYAFSICGIAWIGSAHGLTSAAAAWPVGALLAACVARSAVPRKSPARHRRSGGFSDPIDMPLRAQGKEVASSVPDI